jgi:hypothetical protein
MNMNTGTDMDLDMVIDMNDIDMDFDIDMDIDMGTKIDTRHGHGHTDSRNPTAFNSVQILVGFKYWISDIGTRFNPISDILLNSAPFSRASEIPISGSVRCRS